MSLVKRMACKALPEGRVWPGAGPAIAVAAAVYAVLWVGGVLTYSGAVSPPTGPAIVAPVFLWLALAVVLLSHERRYAAHVVAAAALGWLAEVLGARTGLPFGTYAYGGQLGQLVAGAPLSIGAAWAVLGTAGIAVSRAAGLGRTAAVAAAAWLVLVDLSLDPVAAGPLAFWTWQSGPGFWGVPWTNFAGWFFVGLLVCAPLSVIDVRPASAFVGVSLVLFFAVIALTCGLVWPGVIGLLVAASSMALLIRPGCAEGRE